MLRCLPTGSVSSLWGGSGRGVAGGRAEGRPLPVTLQPCRPGSTQLPAPSSQPLAQEAPPARGKQQSLQVYCWSAKPSSVGSAREPHCCPLWAWGFKLPQPSRLPEQEAGDQAEGQGPGTLSGTPALESPSPVVLVGVGDPVPGGAPSCSPRKPRLDLPSSEAPPAQPRPLRSERRCVCQQRPTGRRSLRNHPDLGGQGRAGRCEGPPGERVSHPLKPGLLSG